MRGARNGFAGRETPGEPHVVMLTPRTSLFQHQPARVTLPALMQLVHTLRRRGAPFTSALTRWMLGSQRRGERLWECDTFMPNPGVFPQTSQTAAMANRW
jgi:hypothetical protein